MKGRSESTILLQVRGWFACANARRGGGGEGGILRGTGEKGLIFSLSTLI